MNIALVEEFRDIFDRMGIDVWEAIEATRTRPVGFKPFYQKRRPGSRGD